MIEPRCLTGEEGGPLLFQASVVGEGKWLSRTAVMCRVDRPTKPLHGTEIICIADQATNSPATVCYPNPEGRQGERGGTHRT